MKNATAFLAAASVMLLVLVSWSSSVSGHGHSHGNGENPSFKYSREANEIHEDEIMEEDIVDLPPKYSSEKPVTREHRQGHGHSHGGHGHSHGGHGHSHDHVEDTATPEEMARRRERLHKIWDEDEDEDGVGSADWSVWLYALSSTLAISLAPFVILFFLGVDNSEANQGRLKVLLAFASGGLLGDAFLHLIPHASMAAGGHGHSHGGGGDHGHSHSHGHTHGHSHGGGEESEEGHVHDLSVGLGILAGIIAFLIVEKLVRILNEGNGGAHGHSHGPPPKPKKEEKKENTKEDAKEESDKKRKTDDEDDKDKGEKSKEIKAKKEKAKEEKKKEEEDAGETVEVAGYLNLAADFFHNFTDGLAIGASFLAGKSIGIVTTLTILFHEVPHEIGDYAILIKSGVSPRKAKFLQLVTAVGAFLGCLMSLLTQGAGDAATVYILPFTAGGFVYIATVSVLPELLQSSDLKQSCKEILALFAGVAIMVVIAHLE